MTQELPQASLEKAEQDGGRFALDEGAMQRLSLELGTKGLVMRDIEPFLHIGYNPQEYANTIIEGPRSARSSKRTAARQLNNGENGKTSSSYDSDAARLSAGTPDNASWLPTSGHVEGDLSVALGRLNLAIDDVDRLIRDQVTSNAAILLNHSTTLMDQRPVLATLFDSLASLEGYQSKLEARVSEPRKILEHHARHLARLRSSHAMVKEAQILVRLFRRLDTQMQALGGERWGGNSHDEGNRLQRLGEDDEGPDTAGVQAQSNQIEDLPDVDDEHTGRGLSRAALTIAQIDALLAGSKEVQSSTSEMMTNQNCASNTPLSNVSQLQTVQDLLPVLNTARETVSEIMEDMVVRGLRDLSPVLLGTSLQTAHNLGQLTDLVRDLVSDLNDVVRNRVRAAFDMQTMARELGSREPLGVQPQSYRARRGEQVAGQQREWSAALWKRLDNLILTEMSAICSKVYTLERVLKLKTDEQTGDTYLALTISLLGDKPTSIFWATFADAIEGQSRRATSAFLVQSLESGYARLIQLLQEFFSKASVHAETDLGKGMDSPEGKLVYESISKFEKAHLSKIKDRFETIIGPWSARAVPNTKEGTLLARALIDELDASRHQAMLHRSSSKLVLTWLDKAIRRIEDLIVSDVSGVDTALIQNAALTNASHRLLAGLGDLRERVAPADVAKAGKLTEDLVQLLQAKLVEPFLKDYIGKEISDIIARMHYVDFGLDHDAVGGNSAYMADLSERLWHMRERVLVHYDVPTASWVLRLSKDALRHFVLHASLLRPLKEGGKLKLTTDMTELEFSISQLLASAHDAKIVPSINDCGEDFAALRGFRHLLFAETTKIEARALIASGVPVHVIAHHIIGRSDAIPFPHTLRKWSITEYLARLETLSDAKRKAEIVKLLQESVNAWRQFPAKIEADAELVKCLESILTLNV